MNRIFVYLALVPLLALTSCVSTGDSAQSAIADKSTFQYIYAVLAGLMEAGPAEPNLAINHSQAEAILPQVKKWKEGQFGLPKDEAAQVYNAILATFNPTQRAWTPRRAGRADISQSITNGKLPNNTGTERDTNSIDNSGLGMHAVRSEKPRPLVTEDYMRMYNDLVGLLAIQ